MTANKRARLNIYTLMPVLAGILVIFDRLFKAMAISGCFNEPVNLIGSYFQLSFAGNTNIAFSLPLFGRPAIAIVLLIMIAIILYAAVLFKKGERGQAFLLLAVVLGAASNLFDRVEYGYVIDYFDVKYLTVFNASDIVIVGSFCIWFAYSIKKIR